MLMFLAPTVQTQVNSRVLGSECMVPYPTVGHKLWYHSLVGVSLLKGPTLYM